MTEKETKEIVIATGLGLLLAWILWHYFRSGQTVQMPDLPPLVDANRPTGLTFPDVTLPVSSPYQLPPTTKDCGCNASSCPISAVTIPTLNQIITSGTNMTNAILAAGNTTLQSIADIAQNGDPFLHVSVTG